jgi:hypothetical protein
MGLRPVRWLPVKGRGYGDDQGAVCRRSLVFAHACDTAARQSVSVRNAASTKMMLQAQGYSAEQSESKGLSEALEDEVETFGDNVFLQASARSPLSCPPRRS